MDFKVNPNRADKELTKAKNKAQRLLEDPEKAQKVLTKAVTQADKVKGPLTQVWDNLQLMIGITRDWFSGKYKQIPLRSIVAILAAIIYLVAPIDMIPDFIPVFGYIDDAFIISIVIDQIGIDLQSYKNWKEAIDINNEGA